MAMNVPPEQLWLDDRRVLMPPGRQHEKAQGASKSSKDPRRSHNAAQMQTGESDKVFQFHQFFQLPWELRDMIYQHMVCFESWVSGPRPGPYKWKPYAANICLANRQAHREANQILYSQNTFHFSCPSYMLHFLTLIGETNKALIQSLSLLLPCYRLTSPFWATVHDQYSSRWASGLAASGLLGIKRMQIVSYHTSFHRDSKRDWGDGGGWPRMTEEVKRGIFDILQRSKDRDITPDLELIGFLPQQRSKFPDDWHVRVDMDISRFFMTFHEVLRVHSTGGEGDGRYLIKKGGGMVDQEG